VGENTQIVERAYARFKAHGETDMELASPEFVWDMTNMEGWPEQPVFEGPEGMRQFLTEWTAVWDDWRLEVERIHESGDKVVALMQQHARSKTTGMPVDMTFAQVWTIRDGKYLRMDMYSDIERALADAGVTP
jgi:ketosteroid isomerase-like protein